MVFPWSQRQLEYSFLIKWILIYSKDILYEKDANGKPTNKLRFSSPKELRDACATDHELGVMVGLLTFEMKYVEAVAGKKFGRSNYKTVPLAIEALKIIP